MYTEYPELFIEVKKRLRGNIAVANLLPVFGKKEKIKDIKKLVDQCIFETLCELEYKNLINNIKKELK